MLKKYQPERTDLLINTDWGIPRDGLTPEEARDRKMSLFHGRWVAKVEKKQLKDEKNAYVSVRMIGVILLLTAVVVVINVGSIARAGIFPAVLAVSYTLVAAISGSGLIRYARWARYPTLLTFCSFLVLPFTPLLADEKSAPLLFVLGVLGLYYLLRRTARRIFWPESRAKSDRRKTSPVLRSIVFGMVLAAGLLAGYLLYDFVRARQMAADACGQAKAGMPLEAFLSKFSKEDYKIIRNSDQVWIVPRRGMGRNHCAVMHDGRTLTGAGTGFAD